MNKIVSASEFKAKCLQLIEQMQRDGQPVTITKRGKVAAELRPKASIDEPLASSFGIFKSERYRFDAEPEDPACDPEDWKALR
ncbi:MAG: type II toxin-antitoxin system prevent-host-death family antitoxin [Pseudomonadota bacterium]